MTIALEPAVKDCTTCGEAKPLDQYNRDANGPGGLAYVCRPCNREYCRKNRRRTTAAHVPTIPEYPVTLHRVAQNHTPTHEIEEDWRHKAACAGQDGETWFPVGNTGPALVLAEYAKSICRSCPVAAACLRWALETNQEAGVWGGMTEDERKSVKRRAARKRARASA